MNGRHPLDSRPPADTLDPRPSPERALNQGYPELTEPLTWRDYSACREWPDVDFFPFPEDVHAISRAKEVCAICPVGEECLTYAIETRQGDGVWGGHTPKERTKLRRKWLEDVRAPAATEHEVVSTREAS